MVLLILVVTCGVAGCTIYNRRARSALDAEAARGPRVLGSEVLEGAQARRLDGKVHDASVPKRACLLIHGWASTPKDFRDVGEALAREGLTVRLMRLPGHGTRPDDLTDRTLEDFLSAVRKEYRALANEFPTVYVAGFSMGGALATLLACEEDVDRLVLIAPFYRIPYHPAYVLPPAWWNRIVSPFVPYVMKSRSFIRVNREAAKDEILCYGVLPTRSVSELVRVGKLASESECLMRVRCPVLWLHGLDDEAASVDAAQDVFDALASGAKKKALYDASNHHLLWDHDGRAAHDEIVAFLTAAWDKEPR